MDNLLRFRDDEAHDEPAITLDSFLDGQTNAGAVRLHGIQPAHQHIENTVPCGFVLARNGAGQHGLIHHAAMQQQKIKPCCEAPPQVRGFHACFRGKQAHGQPWPTMPGDHAPERRDERCVFRV